MTEAINYLHRELNELFQQDVGMWHFVQQALLDGVWYWDLEAPENLWISPRYWECLGYDPDTKEHHPDEFVKVVFEEDLPKVMGGLERHYADPSVPYDQVVRFHHCDGSTVWVRCRGKATRDKTGKAIRMLGAHTDITALKRAEQEAHRAAVATQAANAELTAFTYGLSHDLKSPVSTVGLLLDELLDDDIEHHSDEHKSLLLAARSTNTHMQGIIDHLVEFTRAINEPAEQSPVPLNPLLDETLGSIRAEIDAAEADIRVGSLPTIYGNPHQVRLLFQNLLQNALKFRHPVRPPAIAITASFGLGSDSYQIDVTDNGIGIEPRFHNKIFELFQRLHVRSDIEGFGLGLSLCRRIAQKLNGTLNVRSNVDAGATFSLTVPKYQP